jgi:menaquinone-dependent protoporphyrinogen oxidase
MAEVNSLEHYDALVLGFALYMGRIHKDARRFLVSYKEQLLQMPVAVFCLGPVHADEKEFVEARRQLDKQLTALPWFSPIALEIIGGRFDPQKLGWLRFAPVMRSLPASDARNWEAIHNWAYHLPAALEASAGC